MADSTQSRSDAGEVLRRLPSVDELLEDPEIKSLASRSSRTLLASFVRAALDSVRSEVREARLAKPALEERASRANLVRDVRSRVEREERAGLVRVVNATGVVLHTGLGRAPVHRDAARTMGEIAASYCTLEIDRESGERNQRDDRVSVLFARLLECEAAIAVNNNAAATVLALSSFSRGKETILSRGELVEIGGSFRMPDVMQSAGVILREVGTTNRTRLADYRSAIGANTGLLLKVHTSNFRVQGFVEEVSPRELALLGAEAKLPSVYDLGSGLIDAPNARELDMLGDEPRVRESIASGVDAITFSGDKLLGAPQAGIVAGKRDAIARCRKNPLYRAMRLDKVSLAGLEATLELLLDGRGDEIPTRAMLALDPKELRVRAERIAARLASFANLRVDVIESTSQPGSGSAPGIFLATSAVRIVHSTRGPNALEHALRVGEPPVFARIEGGALLLDPRTLLDGDEERLLAAFEQLGA